MEVAEKFAYRCDQFVPFGLQRAAESELYCAVSQSKAYILELVYSHHCDEKICMEQSTLSDLSKLMPSHGVPKNAANIFNRSTKAEQDRLLVDYHLMTEELKVGSERIALSQTRWSPIQPEVPGRYYLAYLTNYGGCEIRQKHTGKHSWNIVVHNVAKDWMMHCQNGMKYAFNTFDTFEDAVYTIKINAIAWNNVVANDGHLDFCFVTANGTVAFYEITEKLQIRFQKQINRKQIIAIEWFTFVDKHSNRRSYLITSDTRGTVSWFCVQYNQNNYVEDVIEIGDLFTEADGVCANGIQWEYCAENDQLIAVICKGVFVFAYLLSDDAVLSSCMHYVGHLKIHGITKRNQLEYVVGTMSGHLECLRLSINSSTITIEAEEVKSPNGHSKYLLYGLASSLNNAFLLGAYFAGRPYDHLALREPGHIAVCHQLGGLKSLEAMIHNPTYSLEYMQDLAEAVRNVQLRNDEVFKPYLATYPGEILCTNEYIYSLKIERILCATDDLDKRAIELCAYCGKPVDRVKGVCEEEHDIPRCCISMIQVPLMNQRQCIHCQVLALDDVDQLQSIVPSIVSNGPICPLCDKVMDRPHLTFFDNSD